MKKICLLLSLIVIFVSVLAQAPIKDKPCSAIDILVLTTDSNSVTTCSGSFTEIGCYFCSLN